MHSIVTANTKDRNILKDGQANPQQGSANKIAVGYVSRTPGPDAANEMQNIGWIVSQPSQMPELRKAINENLGEKLVGAPESPERWSRWGLMEEGKQQTCVIPMLIRNS